MDLAVVKDGRVGVESRVDYQQSKHTRLHTPTVPYEVPRSRYSTLGSHSVYQCSKSCLCVRLAKRPQASSDMDRDEPDSMLQKVAAVIGLGLLGVATVSHEYLPALSTPTFWRAQS